jgi:hypothetical protein
MLNKIIFQILLLSSVGCTYNPDAGEFVKFSPLSSTNSNTIVLDQFSFTGTSISTIYKDIIIRQVKSDLANASNIKILDYNKKFKQITNKEPDLIMNINIHLDELDEELSFNTLVKYENSNHTTSFRGKGKNASMNGSSSSSERDEIIKLPLNYGRFELTSLITKYNRHDLSYSENKNVYYIKLYKLNSIDKTYPYYNHSFILDNLHEVSGLIVNGILYSSDTMERKIEKSYGSIFISNIGKGLIQKELNNLKKKNSFTPDYKEKSVYLYYLGLIHEIIGQPLIAYDYYEKSIEHDGSNNLPHLAMGIIDRNRGL